jgi:hypothetical protein
MHDYMIAKEAAEYVRLSSITLAKSSLTGSGPAYVKTGRRRHYRRANLEFWMMAHSRASTSEDASVPASLQGRPKQEGAQCAKLGTA